MRESYSIDDLDRLFEETGKQLKMTAWPSIIQRSKVQGIKPTYLGVTRDGRILFKTTSGTTPGKFWYQQIKFKDLEKGLELLINDTSQTQRSMVTLIQKGDLLVHCNDLSFKYWGFQYIGTKKGYSLYTEKRYPKVRNPKLKGSICKHLYVVLTVLPFYTSEIVKDFRSKGVITKNWRRGK